MLNAYQNIINNFIMMMHRIQQTHKGCFLTNILAEIFILLIKFPIVPHV